jgi:DNA-binding response OmpR family regulator
MSTPAFKARVLLLDDSPSARSVMAHRLPAAGYQLSVAKDLAELSMHLANESPDLVLLDVMTPEVFGNDLVGYVRARVGPDAGIFLFSGLEQSHLEELVESSGADGYIRKVDGFLHVTEPLDAFLSARAAKHP